ncbi:PP2C family protein-serine/threonine phosphatase [Streptomyces sp. 2131.1]|uniref:PP2C family protein-serine/threonine phosphatase n=1 Tax=Streptomyces sp. 2131.1 TaxID=1855346 RepID=UPI00210EF288|nr:PP2C family protein-serine/threonine phosphatase [Streptomyces sp. 2131.1]
MDTHHTARTIDTPGILLGIGPQIHLEPRSLHLHPNESLMLYTDGITEARRHDDELFGDERLAEALTNTPDKPTPQQLINAVTQAAYAFTGGHGIDDDQAILVLTANEPG